MPDRPPPSPSVETRLRTLQIVVVALSFGLTAFAVVAAIVPIQTSASLNSAATALLLAMAIAIMFSGLAVRAVARRSTMRLSWDEVDEDRIFARFMVWTIAPAALFEASGLLGAILFLLTRDPAGLLVAGGAVVLMLGACFPTRTRWDSFLADAIYQRP